MQNRKPTNEAVPYAAIATYCEKEYGRNEGDGYTIRSIQSVGDTHSQQYAAFVAVVCRWYTSTFGPEDSRNQKEVRVMSFRSTVTEDGERVWCTSNMIA